MKKSKTIVEPRQLNLEQSFRKIKCEREHLYFTRYFFKQRQNMNFRVNWHHQLIADTLERVLKGELKNVVINVSPGSSKTELVVINFIARGLALNPDSRFLHLSYSDDLSLLNSQTARDIVESDEYQALWPYQLADDAKSKKRWNVHVQGRKAGGVYATALGGQVTGFRAGRMESGFSGALIIDDPLKPEDAFSEPKLKQANRRLLSTVKSRRATPDTPIVLIMQRISEKDPTGFIKAGSLGAHWFHLVIPAVIDDAYVASLDPKYQALIARDGDQRFSYWPYKEPIAELLSMESGEGTDTEGVRMSRHVFAGQYQQNPVAIGGNIIKGVWFTRYATLALPKIKYRKIFGDTAQKTKERNDYSVFECWGFGEDERIYLLDLLRGKWEAPELESNCISFWHKHAAQDVTKLGQLRELVIEDKASGTGLIQKIKKMNFIPVKGIERSIDKLTRVMDVVTYIEPSVCIPIDAPFTHDFVTECEAFTADDSHAFDDQIDPMCDAIVDLLSTRNKLKTWEKLAGP